MKKCQIIQWEFHVYRGGLFGNGGYLGRLLDIKDLNDLLCKVSDLRKITDFPHPNPPYITIQIEESDGIFYEYKIS
jgi:hypothetical protein